MNPSEWRYASNRTLSMTSGGQRVVLICNWCDVNGLPKCKCVIFTSFSTTTHWRYPLAYFQLSPLTARFPLVNDQLGSHRSLSQHSLIWLGSHKDYDDLSPVSRSVHIPVRHLLIPLTHWDYEFDPARDFGIPIHRQQSDPRSSEARFFFSLNFDRYLCWHCDKTTTSLGNKITPRLSHVCRSYF